MLVFVFISNIPDNSRWLLYHSFAMLKFCLDFCHALQNVLVTTSCLINSDLIDMEGACNDFGTVTFLSLRGVEKKR